MYQKSQKKKGAHQRWNHKNYHLARRNKKRRRIMRKSGWKLNYPELFKLVDYFPYIIRKNAN